MAVNCIHLCLGVYLCINNVLSIIWRAKYYNQERDDKIVEYKSVLINFDNNNIL